MFLYFQFISNAHKSKILKLAKIYQNKDNFGLINSYLYKNILLKSYFEIYKFKKDYIQRIAKIYQIPYSVFELANLIKTKKNSKHFYILTYRL